MNITSCKEQENFIDVVSGMIKVFTLDVYVLPNPGENLYFVTFYVANKFEILSEKLRELFCVSAHIGGGSIL